MSSHYLLPAEFSSCLDYWIMEAETCTAYVILAKLYPEVWTTEASYIAYLSTWLFCLLIFVALWELSWKVSLTFLLFFFHIYLTTHSSYSEFSSINSSIIKAKLRVCLDLKQGWLYPCQTRVGVWYKRKKLASDGKLGTNGRKKLAHDGEPNWLACESKKRCAREKKLATATPNVLYSVQVVASKHWASLLWAIAHTG